MDNKDVSKIRLLGEALRGLGSMGLGISAGYKDPANAFKMFQDESPTMEERLLETLQMTLGNKVAESATTKVTNPLEPTQEEVLGGSQRGSLLGVFDKSQLMQPLQAGLMKKLYSAEYLTPTDLMKSQLNVAEDLAKGKNQIDIVGPKIASQKKWEKMAASQIAMSSLSPKINYMMEVGARGYKELKDNAAKYGIELDFDKGGIEFYKAALTKAGLNVAKLTPLMDAASKLRPEIGFEVMRQIGPFRSAQAGLVFTETLPDFTGHIPTDIAKAVTTMTKSFAGALSNEELVKKKLSNEEQVKKTKQYEANLIRAYNKAYRTMGASRRFYSVGLTLEEIAKNSKYTKTEQSLIDFYVKKDKKKPLQVKMALINQGLL